MSDAITRKEAYLKSIGDGTSSALKPITREEQYLAYIAGESNSFPLKPITREEAFLDKIAKRGAGGGGSSINVQPLNATENGTYDAPEGQAYDPVTVDVKPITEPITITENGIYPVPKGGSLEYGKEVKFKEVITDADFRAYMANATLSDAGGGTLGCIVIPGWVFQAVPVGDAYAYQFANFAGMGVAYALNASLTGATVSDGWIKTADQTPTDAPTIVIEEGAEMAADLATTAIFFDIETKSLDGWGDITVNVAGGGTSAIIKPLTITQNGTYNAAEGGELVYDNEVQFKSVITAEDFEAYVANATLADSQQGADMYRLFDDWTVGYMSGIWMIGKYTSGTQTTPSYCLGGSAFGLPDGWALDGKTVDNPPSVSIPAGATMSADLATSSVFFNLERVDAYAPVTVKSKELSAMIAYNNAYVSMVTLYDDFVTDTRPYALAFCGTFRTIELPNVTSLGSYSFQSCEANIVKLPKATNIGTETFKNSNIRRLDLSSCTELNTDQLTSTMLEKLKLNSIVKIKKSGNSTLFCPSLTALILGVETVCEIFAGALDDCQHITGETGGYNYDGLKDGYIYVPKALVDSYKTATNWSKYASQIRAIEDYPEECEF